MRCGKRLEKTFPTGRIVEIQFSLRIFLVLVHTVTNRVKDTHNSNTDEDINPLLSFAKYLRIKLMDRYELKE